jgi:hypothetical protein
MKSKQQKQKEALERRRLDLGHHHAAVSQWQETHRKAGTNAKKQEAHENVLLTQLQLDRCLNDIHNLERKLGV